MTVLSLLSSKLRDARFPGGRSAIVERFALLATWALVVAAFSFALPQTYFTWNNFGVLFASQAPATLLALALIIPLTAGDYDLSVGSTVTLAGMILGVLDVWQHQPLWLSISAGLGAGVAVGLVNALFIVHFRIPSLVVTLGTASIVAGLVQWMSQSATIGGVAPALVDVTLTGKLFGISYVFYYALFAVVLLWYAFEFTPLGRRLLFVGRGREVARLNGIHVGRVRTGGLVASGALAAVAGIFYAGSLGSADPYSGASLLLPAFAAAFLGATAIMPGRFNPWGTFVAVYFLASGITGLSMLGIPLFVTNLFNGGALIVAVTLSQLANGRSPSDQ